MHRLFLLCTSSYWSLLTASLKTLFPDSLNRRGRSLYGDSDGDNNEMMWSKHSGAKATRITQTGTNLSLGPDVEVKPTLPILWTKRGADIPPTSWQTSLHLRTECTSPSQPSTTRMKTPFGCVHFLCEMCLSLMAVFSNSEATTTIPKGAFNSYDRRSFRWLLYPFPPAPILRASALGSLFKMFPWLKGFLLSSVDMGYWCFYLAYVCNCRIIVQRFNGLYLQVEFQYVPASSH